MAAERTRRTPHRASGRGPGLLSSALLVGVLLTAMVLAPWLLYLKGRAVQDRLRRHVDDLDISVERASFEMAHRERQLRLFLLSKDERYLNEFERSSLRISEYLDQARSDLPADRPDWASTLDELVALDQGWEQAVAPLVKNPRQLPAGDTVIAEAAGEPGPIYERYRARSAHISEAIHGERLRLQDDLARMNFVRTIVPVPLAILAVAVLAYVITLTRRVETLLERVADQRQRLATVIEQMTDAVVVVDERGVVSLANRAAERLLTASPGDRMDRLLRARGLRRGEEAVGERDVPVVRSLQGDTIHGEELTLGGGSTERHLSISSTPIVDPKGRRIGAVMAVRDVTVRTRFEQERVEVEKLRAVAQMAERVAHDFGNFLEAAGAATSMLERPKLRDPEQNKRWITIIKDTLEQARSALQALHTLAFTAAKQPRFQRCDSNALVDRAIEVIKLARPDALGAIEIRHERGDVPPIEAAEGELLRSLVNLLINAIDAMPNGGKLDVSVRSRSDEVVIEVRDTGKGIEREHLERVFDLYFTTKPEGGSGLGLTTAREVIALHGGTLEVQSEVGVGSTFTVRLPIQGAPSRATRRSSMRIPVAPPAQDR